MIISAWKVKRFRSLVNSSLSGGRSLPVYTLLAALKSFIRCTSSSAAPNRCSEIPLRSEAMRISL